MRPPRQPAVPDSKTRLIESAIQLIRERGYADTSVEDLCSRAGVSKGSLFHHFKTKDDLTLGAIDHWNQQNDVRFGNASYRKLKDPLDRLFGYLDFRASLLQGDVAEYTCLFGTLTQEAYATHPSLRAASKRGLDAAVAELTRDIAAAKKLYAPRARWSARSVGYFVQAALQGSFVFAKAHQGPEVVHANIEHLRNYFRLLFGEPHRKRNQS